MTITLALLLAASGNVAAEPRGGSRGDRAENGAEVSVTIVRPAVVKGGQPDEATLERAEITRREGRILIEFQ